jgi:hypothetical protein
MSIKKILMAASAVTALTAGSAGAVNITEAKVSNIGLTAPTIATGAGATAYTLANSAIVVDSSGVPNANAQTGASTEIVAMIGGTTSAGVFDPNPGGTNYSATYTLTNATFSSAVTNDKISLLNAGSSCNPGAVNVVSGGAVGTSSVTAVFNIPSTNCSSPSGTNNTAPNAVKFVAPFKILSAGAVTGTVGFKIVATDSAFDVRGVTGGAITLVRTAAPYTTTVEADTTATTLGLGTGTEAVYSKFSTADVTIGKVTVQNRAPGATAVGDTVYADMNGTARPGITYDLKVDATSGNFAVIKPLLAENTSTAAAMTLATSSSASATKTGAAAGTGTISVSIGASNTTSLNAAQTYSATITPILASNSLVTTPAAVTGALQTIGLAGTSFLAPWIGGSLSSSSSFIRVSNNGSAATGQVSVSLLSPIGAATPASAGAVCTSATLEKLKSIAGSNELVLTPADLTTCFGNFTRGDVVVTIQSTSTSLTAKARNVTPTSVSELSLGKGTFTD